MHLSNPRIAALTDAELDGSRMDKDQKAALEPYVKSGGVLNVFRTLARATGVDVEKVRDERNKRVPLGGKMGTAWDTAHAILFLASDEARFITGAVLPVDGGASVRIG